MSATEKAGGEVGGVGGGEAILFLLCFPASIIAGYMCYRAWSYIIERIRKLASYKEQEKYYNIKITNLRRRIVELDEELVGLNAARTGKKEDKSSFLAEESNLEKPSKKATLEQQKKYETRKFEVPNGK